MFRQRSKMTRERLVGSRGEDQSTVRGSAEMVLNALPWSWMDVVGWTRYIR